MNSKEQLIANFDPNAPGTDGYLFGLPFTEEHAEVIIIPVPWEATVSSRTGTAHGPEAIHEASLQVDLFVHKIPDAWKLGINMLPIEAQWLEESRRTRQLVTDHIRAFHAGDKRGEQALFDVNKACEGLNLHVKNTANKYLDQNKLVGIVGGDHSVALGLMQALSDRNNPFGILQIDAHADLRSAYEGFTYSHASIMHNALKLPGVQRLVQVGLRDYCEEEYEAIKQSKDKVVLFLDEDLKTRQYEGETWLSQCDAIINSLPQQVYISFDVDGLDPKLCPHTGTPVPGGFEFYQMAMLLECVVKSGRKIIGFDLNEVSPSRDNDWDANVGARLLYLICNWMAVSQGRLKAQDYKID